MKRFLPLFIIALAFSSCQEDVKFSNPGFQALKDDAFWRANDVRAYVSETGALTIEAYNQYEQLTFKTSSANEGTYLLGTSNTNNYATYSNTMDGNEMEYATVAVPGPVANVSLQNAGTGYATATQVATTGGSGSGLTVDITANATGNVTKVTPVARGNGYIAGDLVTIAGGNVNAKFRVVNVQNSNGQIVIEEYDTEKATISGTFKLNLTKTDANPFGGPILNFQNGEFYKIPIYPSI